MSISARLNFHRRLPRTDMDDSSRCDLRLISLGHRGMGWVGDKWLKMQFSFFRSCHFVRAFLLAAASFKPSTIAKRKQAL